MRGDAMQKPNENGVYEAEIVEELARRDRSHATVEICQCEDGRYRYALDMAYSYGGFGSPITGHGEGYASPADAKNAAAQHLLMRFPEAWPSEPASVHAELRELKTQVEDKLRQPTLF
jgi:hypothetical protein